MKRFLPFILCLAVLLSIALTPLTASAAGEGWYMVQSTSPNGYCYLYSAASDRDEFSRNLGRYNNGELVYVIDYYGGQEGKYNYCYVQTQNGDTGYMHDYALTRYYGAVWSSNGEGWYQVQSTSPNGYCYLYSAASDRDEISRNMGRYNNGELVYVLDYNGGQEGKYNYCYVQTQDGRTGYMHDYSLTRYYGAAPNVATTGWYVVNSTSPKGYCYLYSAASDRSEISRNLGRHNNGEVVYVLDYYGGQEGKYNYCYVRTMDGKTGYIHDYALTHYMTWLEQHNYAE